VQRGPKKGQTNMPTYHWKASKSELLRLLSEIETAVHHPDDGGFHFEMRAEEGMVRIEAAQDVDDVPWDGEPIIML